MLPACFAGSTYATEIQSPEFHDYPIAYPAEDEIPKTALAFVRHLLSQYSKPFVLSSLALQQAMEAANPAAGHVLDAQTDQPKLAPIVVSFNGNTHEHRADVHAAWIAQRSQRYFQSLSCATQEQVLATFASDNGRALLTVPQVGDRASRQSLSQAKPLAVTVGRRREG